MLEGHENRPRVGRWARRSLALGGRSSLLSEFGEASRAESLNLDFWPKLMIIKTAFFQAIG